LAHAQFDQAPLGLNMDHVVTITEKMTIDSLESHSYALQTSNSDPEEWGM